MFVNLMRAIKGKEMRKHHVAIENAVSFGCGRQALRVLDTSMSLYGERLALAGKPSMSH